MEKITNQQSAMQVMGLKYLQVMKEWLIITYNEKIVKYKTSNSNFTLHLNLNYVLSQTFGHC